MKCESYKLDLSIDFISIVLARAILKISFLGSNYLIKNYYNDLEGNEEFNEKHINIFRIFLHYLY